MSSPGSYFRLHPYRLERALFRERRLWFSAFTDEKSFTRTFPLLEKSGAFNALRTLPPEDKLLGPMLESTEDTQPLDIWHMRLGHLNERAITQLAPRSTGMTIGVPTHDPSEREVAILRRLSSHQCRYSSG